MMTMDLGIELPFSLNIDNEGFLISFKGKKCLTVLCLDLDENMRRGIYSDK
jgi:hypothetical protein